MKLQHSSAAECSIGACLCRQKGSCS